MDLTPYRKDEWDERERCVRACQREWVLWEDGLASTEDLGVCDCMLRRAVVDRQVDRQTGESQAGLKKWIDRISDG